MNRKGFVNIILVVVIVTIVTVAGYFALVKKSPSMPNDQQTINNTPPPSVEGKTPKDNPPPIAQKKITIHCNPEKKLPPSSGSGNVQSPLSVSLILLSPCPLADSTMDGQIKTSLYNNSTYPLDVKTISVILSAEGNIAITSPKTYSIDDFILTTKDIKLLVTGPGMGSLNVHADGIQNNGNKNEILGSSDSAFFLLASDGEFIVSRSSYFELERVKLTNDLQAGLIDKSKYDAEFRKMLEGKHTYVCSQITCY